MEQGQEIVPIETKPVNIESLISMAITQKLPVETMEKFLIMAKEVKQMYAKEQFYKALAKFQSETPAVEKSKKVKYDTKTGGRVDYHYAPIEVIVDAVKSGLEKNGFSYTLKTEQTETKITVTCEAHHVAGHTESTSLTVPMSTGDKMNAIQQIGAAITYAKRYSFCNAFGIMTADEDNDSNVIEGEVVKEPAPKTADPKPAEAKQPEKKPGELTPEQNAVLEELKNKFKEVDLRPQDEIEIVLGLLAQGMGHKFSDWEITSMTVDKATKAAKNVKQILEGIVNPPLLKNLVGIVRNYRVGDKLEYKKGA